MQTQIPLVYNWKDIISLADRSSWPRRNPQRIHKRAPERAHRPGYAPEMESRKLANLIEVSEWFRLPARWVKDEALAGRLPVLKVGRRLLFDIDAVERALVERAGEAREVAHA